MEKINKDAPHRAMILVKWENHELTSDGKCNARPSSRGSTIYSILGKDLSETETLVQKFIQEINDAIKKRQA